MQTFRRMMDAIVCKNIQMADRRVTAAIDHWAPRFVANGVDAADFARVTAAIDDWSGWCAAWCEAGAEHERLGRVALGDGRARSGGAHLAQAAVYYHFAKFMFVQDMPQLQAAHAAAVRCRTDALPYLDPPGERIEIPFDGAVLAGILRRPKSAGPAAVVVMISGLDSAKEELGATEGLFLDRGLATFSVDGPGQGEAEYGLAIRPDWEIPGGAILDAVSALPGLDPARIGIWGVSLGGYYAARLASGDRRVRACVALCGPYSLGAVWDQLPELSRDAFMVRSKAATAKEARLRADELTMAGRAGLLTAPFLVVAGQRDRIFPWEQARRLADEAGGEAELLLLAEGNHGCANLLQHHRPYTADWMARQLAR
jgi:2,6-dihydroxypseudooxynicotine hydrolase